MWGPAQAQARRSSGDRRHAMSRFQRDSSRMSVSGFKVHHHDVLLDHQHALQPLTGFSD